eukprot:3899563-Rhodomonas_salina.3
MTAPQSRMLITSAACVTSCHTLQHTPAPQPPHPPHPPPSSAETGGAAGREEEGGRGVHPRVSTSRHSTNPSTTAALRP